MYIFVNYSLDKPGLNQTNQRS